VKKIFSLIVVATLALLSACENSTIQTEGVQIAAIPNEKFLSWFRPTLLELAQLEGGIRDVDIRSTHEHETIYLRQVIGSSHSLYFTIETMGEAEINHIEVLCATLAEQESWRASTATGNVLAHHLPEKSGYLVRFFPEPPLYEGQELVLRLKTNNATHEISFVPNVSAPVNITPILHENGEQIGQMVTSAVHMYIEIIDIDGSFADKDTFPLVNVGLKNGESIRPIATLSRIQPQNMNVSGAGVFLGEDKNTPRQFFVWLERQNLWIIDEIIYVEFGGIDVFPFDAKKHLW